MKKTDIILILVVVAIIVGAVILGQNKTEKTHYDLPVTIEGTAGLADIDYATYKSLQEANKPFIVIIAQTGCHYCEQYRPVVEKVATELGIPFNWIDMSKMSEEDYTVFMKSNTFFRRNKQWGTPTTLLLNNSDTIATINGYVDEDGLKSFLSTNVKVGE